MRLRISARKIALDLTEYLFVLIMILNCNTIWTSYEDTQVNKVLKVAVVVAVALYLAVNRSVRASSLKHMFLAFVLAGIYWLIYALVVQYHMISFLYFVIDIFCVYVFVLVARDNGRGMDVLMKYRNLIVIIAVISLFFWLFGSVLGIIHSTGYVYSTWTGNDSVKTVTSYYGIYFETQSYATIIRNTSIFTEAPMHNFHLCIALLIELFYCRKISKINCVILIVTVLSTISTTGYCMVIIALVAKYMFTRSKSGFFRTLKVVIIPLAMIVALIVLQSLVLDKLSTSSGSTRLDDFAAGIAAWKTNPLFGAGYGNGDYVKQFMSSFRSNNQGFSNSPTMILYQGGIFLAIPYVYFICKWIWTCVRERDMQKFLLFANFLFLFTITVTPYKFLTAFLFFACCIPREGRETSLKAKAQTRAKVGGVKRRSSALIRVSVSRRL